MTTCALSPPDAAQRARWIREKIPAAGLFTGHEWRIAPAPLALGPEIASELSSLGRVLLQFYRAVNLLYRQSLAGTQPPWVSAWLDQGKPRELLELQREHVFKNDLPRVIRPDILMTESGLSITELDSVPGGIGLTAWLNQVYSELENSLSPHQPESSWRPGAVLGGADGMLQGFAGMFADASRVHVVVSAESATYRPEMQWLTQQLSPDRFSVRGPEFTAFSRGDAVYRFFELFDLANVPASSTIFRMARERQLLLTPPPKPIFEEKMLFALLWNRNLRAFWRQQLGEAFFRRMQQLVPYTWVVDPAPLPPHGAIPRLDITEWSQLESLSQKARNLVLKVSGFSEHAWGARGVYVGSDLSQADWAIAVRQALANFQRSPYVLQPFEKPKLVEGAWFDFEHDRVVPMPGRVRLCPYYFVHGQAEAARPVLGGVLATICPADKKIIHGMKDAIMAPCTG